MAWLLSYRYCLCDIKNGRFVRSEEVDTIELVDEHPAAFVAASLENVRALNYGRITHVVEPGHPVFQVVRVYSAIEIPDGALTPAQLDALQ